jgi:DNA-binding IscR family transcriptional regulator
MASHSVDGGEMVDRALWVSISELARIKGRSKQAVSKRVKRLVENRVLETKGGDGGKVLVNRDGYDHATGAEIDRALWVSLSELSRIIGTSKQAVSKRVKRLVESQLLQTMAGDGGEVLVDRVSYGRAIGENTDPAQICAGSSILGADGGRR